MEPEYVPGVACHKWLAFGCFGQHEPAVCIDHLTCAGRLFTDLRPLPVLYHDTVRDCCVGAGMHHGLCCRRDISRFARGVYSTSDDKPAEISYSQRITPELSARRVMFC